MLYLVSLVRVVLSTDFFCLAVSADSEASVLIETGETKWQPNPNRKIASLVSIQAMAKAAGLKLRKDKKPGEPTRYYGTASKPKPVKKPVGRKPKEKAPAKKPVNGQEPKVSP